MGEDTDFSVPISRGPYLSEFRVEGLVELALDVGLVGGEPGSDTEVGGGEAVVRCLKREKCEEGKGEEEGEGEWFEN